MEVAHVAIQDVERCLPFIREIASQTNVAMGSGADIEDVIDRVKNGTYQLYLFIEAGEIENIWMTEYKDKETVEIIVTAGRNFAKTASFINSFEEAWRRQGIRTVIFQARPAVAKIANELYGYTQTGVTEKLESGTRFNLHNMKKTLA